MNERRILFHVLTIGLLILTMAFVLLFVYVDARWWDLRAIAINPIRTVIATVVMIAIGMIVYVKRNKRC